MRSKSPNRSGSGHISEGSHRRMGSSSSSYVRNCPGQIVCDPQLKNASTAFHSQQQFHQQLIQQRHQNSLSSTQPIRQPSPSGAVRRQFRTNSSSERALAAQQQQYEQSLNQILKHGGNSEQQRRTRQNSKKGIQFLEVQTMEVDRRSKGKLSEERQSYIQNPLQQNNSQIGIENLSGIANQMIYPHSTFNSNPNYPTRDSTIQGNHHTTEVQQHYRMLEETEERRKKIAEQQQFEQQLMISQRQMIKNTAVKSQLDQLEQHSRRSGGIEQLVEQSKASIHMNISTNRTACTLSSKKGENKDLTTQRGSTCGTGNIQAKSGVHSASISLFANESRRGANSGCSGQLEHLQRPIPEDSSSSNSIEDKLKAVVNRLEGFKAKGVDSYDSELLAVLASAQHRPASMNRLMFGFLWEESNSLLKILVNALYDVIFSIAAQQAIVSMSSQALLPAKIAAVAAEDAARNATSASPPTRNSTTHDAKSQQQQQQLQQQSKEREQNANFPSGISEIIEGFETKMLSMSEEMNALHGQTKILATALAAAEAENASLRQLIRQSGIPMASIVGVSGLSGGSASVSIGGGNDYAGGYAIDKAFAITRAEEERLAGMCAQLSMYIDLSKATFAEERAQMAAANGELNRELSAVSTNLESKEREVKILSKELKECACLLEQSKIYITSLKVQLSETQAALIASTATATATAAAFAAQEKLALEETRFLPMQPDVCSAVNMSTVGGDTNYNRQAQDMSSEDYEQRENGDYNDDDEDDDVDRNGADYEEEEERLKKLQAKHNQALLEKFQVQVSFVFIMELFVCQLRCCFDLCVNGSNKCNGRIQANEDMKVLGQMVLEALKVLLSEEQLLPNSVAILRDEIEAKKQAILEKLSEAQQENIAIYDEFEDVSDMLVAKKSIGNPSVMSVNSSNGLRIKKSLERSEKGRQQAIKRGTSSSSSGISAAVSPAVQGTGAGLHGSTGICFMKQSQYSQSQQQTQQQPLLQQQFQHLDSRKKSKIVSEDEGSRHLSRKASSRGQQDSSRGKKPACRFESQSDNQHSFIEDPFFENVESASCFNHQADTIAQSDEFLRLILVQAASIEQMFKASEK